MYAIIFKVQCSRFNQPNLVTTTCIE